MSLLLFWALNVVVVLLSKQDQKAIGFNQKYLNLCLKMNEGIMGLDDMRVSKKNFILGELSL